MTKKEFLVRWLMEWGRGAVRNNQLYAKDSVYMQYIGISRIMDVERLPLLAMQGLLTRERPVRGFTGEWQYRLSDKALDYIANGGDHD